MEAKKSPALLATLAVFGLVALAGAGFTVFAYLDFSDASVKLAAADKKVASLLKSEVALTRDNVDAAQSNLRALKDAEASLRLDLSGAGAGSFDDKYTGAPGDLGAVIKDSVEGWRTVCRKAGVRLAVPKPDDFSFGYSRYFQTGGTPPSRFTAQIHRQTRVTDFLVKSLLASKAEDDLRLVAVSREPVEVAGVARGNFAPDEVDPSTRRDSVLRREGLLRSEFFSVKFVARTEVLRRFVNTVTASGRSLAVRGVEVTQATPEQLAAAPGPAGAVVALPADLFGAPAPAQGAPAAEAKPDAPVVTDTPSLFTVTLEYIEPVAPSAHVESADNANN